MENRWIRWLQACPPSCRSHCPDPGVFHAPASAFSRARRPHTTLVGCCNG
jgi:hypothetical protein